MEEIEILEKINIPSYAVRRGDLISIEPKLQGEELKARLQEIKEIPDVSLAGDRIYLEKLFSNIISNAIFYGKEKGSIIINAKKDKKYIIITIKDNGIGIEKEDLPNIFNRFYRAENARDTKREGTGLGLAISKWIVESHDGNIEVSSVIKKGTTFTISLPLFL